MGKRSKELEEAECEEPPRKNGKTKGRLTRQTQLFINNEFVDAQSGKTFDTINPRTEEVICSVQEAGAADVDLAVAAAAEAFKTWKDSDGSLRRNLLLKLADLMEKHQDQLAELEALDNGKPEHVAKGVDIMFCIECYRYYAGWADKVCGKTIPLTQGTASNLCYTRHEPVGVVGQIIPWNFPLLMQAWKLGPALAMGCTVVMKLSEKTPLSGLLMCQLIREAGYPPGVVNILNGPGIVGEFIVRHMSVKKVAFTGSTAVGHKIVKMAAESNLKKVSVELGGKSAIIVCKDADLDQAVMASHVGLWINMGQCCCASSRIFVHEDVYDEFVQKSVDMAKTLKCEGDASDKQQAVPICELGPQIDRLQMEKILGYIETGKQEGAKCEMGGGRLGTTGYFVKPTIFSNVKDRMTIAQEEIFGPVMQILKFRTLDHAIKRANSSQYGLAAGIMTRDTGTAHKAAAQLEAGTVWINCFDNFDMACPFGGFKQSGWGRDKGEYALENYTEVKCVIMPMDSRH